MMLQEEKRLISQLQIRHIVGQINELSVGCASQPAIENDAGAGRAR